MDGTRHSTLNLQKGMNSLKEKCSRKMKNIRFAAAGGILLLLACAMQAAARGIPGFATWYAHTVYPVLVGSIGRFFGVFPFSAVEFGMYLLVVGCIVYVVRFVREPLRLVSRTLFLCGLLLFLFTANCGINYSAMAFSQYAGLETGQYSVEELKELCEYLVEQVNENATDESYSAQRAEWRREGIRAMQKAGEEFPVLGGYYPKPKQVAVSWILSVQQLCGIYVPFTIEANFNGAMPDYNIPHTICHELSHLKGFMREDEANFIGYLACTSSDNQAFRYSGYLTGWVYAGNALARVDMDTYRELTGRLCSQAQADLQENSQFWNRYEGRVAEAANQMNDTYLKMNRQTDGVQSYGRMVDLMLAYRREK